MADLPYMSHNEEEEMAKRKKPEVKVILDSAQNAKRIAIDTLIGVAVLLILTGIISLVFVSRATNTRVSSNLPLLLHPKELAKETITNLLSQATKPKPGNCLVVEEQYCNGKLVYRKGDLVGVGYDVPTGTTVFAPEDGVVVPLSVTQKNSNTVLYTYAVLYVTENGDVKNASYLISVLSNLKVTSPIGKEIHRGDAIGRVISAIPGADAPLVVRVVSNNASLTSLYKTYLSK